MGARKTVQSDPPELLRARIEEFMRGCRVPALLEPGEKKIRLEPGMFDLQIHGTAVVLHAWSAEANLVRRIVRVREEQRGRLELEVVRLGLGDGSIAVIDLARAGTQFQRQADRMEFRERFRRMLAREFPDWKIAQISAAADLEHSLSPAYARALLVRGRSAFVAIGTDADPATCDHILSFGLIWLDYLRQREPRRVVEGLKLFLPKNRSRATANRLAFLDASRARYELYEFGRDGSVAREDEKNYGNLATELATVMAAADPGPPVSEWIERLVERFGAERVRRPDGLISLRVRGLEFARASGLGMTFGLEENLPVGIANFPLVEELAGRLASARSAEAGDTQHWLYRLAPEKWLESLARTAIARLDGALLPDPIYSQAPSMAGVDRGILDLVAVDRSGRLAVLELKASEDIHLPLQGLDYWMRVKWHLDHGDFSRRGYFPGVELKAAPPRLLLVSPVFDFHPTTETILQYFSSQVEVERVGLGMEWRRELKIVFRAHGAERPA